MAYIDSLTSAQTNIAIQLAAVTANPQPNYSADGESYDYSEYVNMLTEKLKVIEQAIQRAGGPYQLLSRGST